MIKKTEKAYEVKRAFNNNIVLVDDDEKEIILFAKGIGFNCKKGSIILFSIALPIAVQNLITFIWHRIFIKIIIRIIFIKSYSNVRLNDEKKFLIIPFK